MVQQYIQMFSCLFEFCLLVRPAGCFFSRLFDFGRSVGWSC